MPLAPIVRRSSADLLVRIAIAAGAGAVGGVAFPPRTWPLLLVASVAVLLALLIRESAPRAGLIGLAFGLGWFGVVVHWAQVVGTDGWVVLALVCAVFIAVMAAGIALVQRMPLAPLWVAAVWVLQESARSSIPFGGFPWGRVADGAGPGLSRQLSFGGFSFVTFSLVLIAATVVLAVDSQIGSAGPDTTTGRPAMVLVLVLATVLVLPLVFSSAGRTTTTGSIRVAVVQGDVPGEGLDFLGRKRAVLQNHVRVTQELADAVASGKVSRPDVVVWPENSTDIDPILDREARGLIQKAVDAIKVPILLGTVLESNDPTRVRNAAVLWEPGKEPQVVYVKQRPVPFGEYLPFRSVIGPLVSRFDRVPRDFEAGTSTGVVQVGGATLGLAICFEVAHDDIQRASVQDGADLLVVLTNNATYSLTDQPDQQFSITRQRSIELGRATVVAATTGISAVVGSDGQAQARLPVREPGYLVEDVDLTGGTTLAVRAGQGIETGLAIVGLLAVIVAAATRRRRPERATAQRQEQV